MVTPQGLLVPRGAEGGLSTGFLTEHEIGSPRGILVRLVECQYPRGTMLLSSDGRTASAP